MSCPTVKSLQASPQTCRSASASMPGPAPSDVTSTRMVVAVVGVQSYVPTSVRSASTWADSPGASAPGTGSDSSKHLSSLLVSSVPSAPNTSTPGLPLYTQDCSDASIHRCPAVVLTSSLSSSRITLAWEWRTDRRCRLLSKKVRGSRWKPPVGCEATLTAAGRLTPNARYKAADVIRVRYVLDIAHQRHATDLT